MYVRTYVCALHCLCSSSEILDRLQGSEVNLDYFEGRGFSRLVLVEEKAGLGMTVPPASFTVADVESYVGTYIRVKVGSQYDAERCVASCHVSVETPRDAGIEPNSIPA